MRTIDEIRCARLSMLRSEFGSRSALNRAMNLTSTDSTFSQIMSAKTKKAIRSVAGR